MDGHPVSGFKHSQEMGEVFLTDGFYIGTFCGNKHSLFLSDLSTVRGLLQADDENMKYAIKRWNDAIDGRQYLMKLNNGTKLLFDSYFQWYSQIVLLVC